MKYQDKLLSQNRNLLLKNREFKKRLEDSRAKTSMENNNKLNRKKLGHEILKKHCVLGDYD